MRSPSAHPCPGHQVQPRVLLASSSSQGSQLRPFCPLWPIWQCLERVVVDTARGSGRGTPKQPAMGRTVSATQRHRTSSVAAVESPVLSRPELPASTPSPRLRLPEATPELSCLPARSSLPCVRPSDLPSQTGPQALPPCPPRPWHTGSAGRRLCKVRRLEQSMRSISKACWLEA